MSTKTVTLQWHENDQRDYGYNPYATPTGPQIFSENPGGDHRAHKPGTALKLDYEDWQALGGPTTIVVRIGAST